MLPGASQLQPRCEPQLFPAPALHLLPCAVGARRLPAQDCGPRLLRIREGKLKRWWAHADRVPWLPCVAPNSQDGQPGWTVTLAPPGSPTGPGAALHEDPGALPRLAARWRPHQEPHLAGLPSRQSEPRGSPVASAPTWMILVTSPACTRQGTSQGRLQKLPAMPQQLSTPSSCQGSLQCEAPGPPTARQVQPDNPPFSRGIRQRLAKAAREHSWLDKHRIAVGE